MRQLILVAAVAIIAAAKPETYREQEDFKYSRSSSDDGTKAGYYGAQRGNMGGNYERAHNMDTLAQHQMNGLVRQVEGDLGDGVNTRTGSVYTAANSKGIYGSGRYDLSSLGGRNFQEGTTYGDLQLQSKQSSSTNSAYNSHSESSQYDAGNYANQALQSSVQDQNTYGVNQYHHGGQTSQHSSGYNAQYESKRHSELDNSNLNSHSSGLYGSNAQIRTLYATPVRVVVRPGSTVAIPLATQIHDNVQNSASSFDQNAINTETEVIGNREQNFGTHSKPKFYDSAYSYHKEWEKHDSSPAEVTVAVPYNSELYEDTQKHSSAKQFETESAHSNNLYNGYNANVKSTYGVYSGEAGNAHSMNYNNYNTKSSLSSQSNYDNQLNQRLSNSNSHSTLNSGAAALNGLSDLDTKPRSYQSSYSYHKSWERQGDPYIIKPVSGAAYNGQTSQKLTDSFKSQGTSTSHQYGSHYQNSHQGYISGTADCDENGHIRVPRSYNTDQIQDLYNQHRQQEVGQQQQNPWQNTEELGQQAQNQWNNLGDLGQQSQKLDNLQDLGQQTQQKWDNLENLGQQTQNKWDNLENLGQQTQNTWDNLENLGQQTQNQWDKFENLGQQTQSKWDNLEKSGQQTQNKLVKLENLGQQTQNQWDNLENLGQQTQNQWDNLENLGQQTQNKWSNYGQQTSNSFGTKFEDLGQHTNTEFDSSRIHQQSQGKLEDFGQQTQSKLGNR